MPILPPRAILMIAVLWAVFRGSVHGAEDSHPLATLDLPRVKRIAEQGILRSQPRLSREDLKFQYAYHRVEPSRLIGADIVVAVYTSKAAKEVRREQVGGMVRITLSREHHTVELETTGQLIRSSSRVVEETEIRELPPTSP